MIDDSTPLSALTVGQFRQVLAEALEADWQRQAERLRERARELNAILDGAARAPPRRRTPPRDRSKSLSDT